MKTFKQYKAETLLMIMFMVQILTVFIPDLFPAGISEILLLVLLIVFVLCKINSLDLALKRKYN